MRVFTSLLFVIWLYLWMAILGILFLPALILPRWATIFGIRTYARTIRLGLRLICGISTEIRGRENMPEGPVIYAGKHQCMYDVFIPFLVMRDPAIIMKKELLWYPFLGWYALKAAMIPIDRAGTTRTLKAMVGEAKQRADNYRQIVIFRKVPARRRAPRRNIMRPAFPRWRRPLRRRLCRWQPMRASAGRAAASCGGPARWSTRSCRPYRVACRAGT
jgi:1-acyl-sn-glycerol-3-phosphate acyltransferase